MSDRQKSFGASHVLHVVIIRGWIVALYTEFFLSTRQLLLGHGEAASRQKASSFRRRRRRSSGRAEGARELLVVARVSHSTSQYDVDVLAPLFLLLFQQPVVLRNACNKCCHEWPSSTGTTNNIIPYPFNTGYQLQPYWTIYRVASKNVRLITLSNIDQFSNLFHCQNLENICNNTITMDPTTPQICRYTALWNVSVLKQQRTRTL